MNGFDLDGVLTLGIRPAKGDVIITGRSFELARETLLLLRDMGIDNQVFFSPLLVKQENRQELNVNWKSDVINVLRINTYFEDDDTVVDRLRDQCLGTLIVHVNPGFKDIPI